MNEKKIAFVYCVNDQSLYEKSVSYINKIKVPDGYGIELIAVENASSMTSGYNKGMRQTDAKYKVYLHQDVFIQNQNFINDVLAIFQENKKIGLIGVAGAKVIPTNGIWWEAKRRYGKVYDSHTGQLTLLAFYEVVADYESVQAIDGLIMVTQYDIPWREDIFNGWHFYDISQSVEFVKSGLEVVVPKQEEVWCVHDCGIVNIRNGYEHYRIKFLGEYFSYLYK